MIANGQLTLHFIFAESFLAKRKFRDRVLPESYAKRLISEFGGLEMPVSNDDLKRHFAAARQSELRLDAVRCQLLLDQARAI